MGVIWGPDLNPGWVGAHRPTGGRVGRTFERLKRQAGRSATPQAEWSRRALGGRGLGRVRAGGERLGLGAALPLPSPTQYVDLPTPARRHLPVGGPKPIPSDLRRRLVYTWSQKYKHFIRNFVDLGFRRSDSSCAETCDRSATVNSVKQENLGAKGAPILLALFFVAPHETRACLR